MPARKKTVKPEKRNELSIVEQQKMIDVITSDDFADNSLSFEPNAPVLKNKEQIMQVINSINERNKDLVLTDEQIKEYNKQGGTISNLRKLSKNLTALKTQVNKKVKDANAQFVNDINDLVEALDLSIDNLAEQVDARNLQIKEEKIENTRQVFEEIKTQGFADSKEIKNIKYIADFENWFDNTKIKLSDKKLREDINEWLTNQIKEYNQAKKNIKSNINKDVVDKLFNEHYQGNAIESLNYAIDQAEHVAELAKQLQEQKEREAAAKQAAEQAPVATQEVEEEYEEDEDDNVDVVSNTTYFFAVFEAADAKKVKEFIEENNIDFQMKVTTN